MTTLRVAGYDVDVQTSFAGGKHSATEVFVHTTGSRGGKHAVTVPSDPRALSRFVIDMLEVSDAVKAEEKRQVALARKNGVLK